ncbi:MAG: hypothetical protein ACYTEZ_12340 [Planctomycetota bacterium]|jgi:Na+/melibiose symporter-like transporter
MNDEKKYWLDSPRNVRKIVYALAAICVLLVLADLLYHKHLVFGCEGWFGFYGFYGFVCCIFLVLTAKQLRRVLMRREDYYDDDE